MDADPEVKFSEWVAWADRPRLKRRDGPWLGVYLWARFETPPLGTNLPYPQLPDQLIYVGETKHIDIRPLTGDHHRLDHYRETFPDDPDLKKLYLSIGRIERFPSGYAEAQAQARYRKLRVFTQFIESKIYWEFTKPRTCPPALHYKRSRKSGGS